MTNSDYKLMYTGQNEIIIPLAVSGITSVIKSSIYSHLFF